MLWIQPLELRPMEEKTRRRLSLLSGTRGSMKFDISEKKFQSLAEEKPVMIQLMAKVNIACSPLGLYSSLDKKCTYLLESVEKEKRHARFSFVGADPDAVVTIKNRKVTLDYSQRTNLT